MKDKIENFIIQLRSSIFYARNKRTGISKTFAEMLFYQGDRAKNIKKMIQSCKTPEELKEKAKREFSTISNDLLLTNFIIGVQSNNYPIRLTNIYSKELLRVYLEHDYTPNDTEQLIEEYKDIIFRYITSDNHTKNSIQRGTKDYNDLTKSVTPELINSIFSNLTYDQSTLSTVDYENVEVINEILIKLQTVYPKNILFNNKEFVQFELLTGLTEEYFYTIRYPKHGKPIPSLEERINYYESRSSLTADQTIKLNNLELLEQRIKTIHHKNKQELLDLLTQIKEEKNLNKKIELLEECFLLYEITYREEIVDSLFTPTSSIEITDINQLQNCLIHKFISRSGDLLSGYDKILKKKIIEESRDKNPDRELTKEEQERFDKLMEYAKNVLANKVVVEETIETDLIYSDQNGWRRYKSDTSNQISTSLLPLTEDAIRSLRGFIGIGFDKTTLTPENIAISSSAYKTTNMGIENLEVSPEEEFEELSAPLSELEQVYRAQSEVVLFRKGMEMPTKASYVFVGVEDTRSPEYVALIKEAKQIAESNNLKLIVFNINKIIKSMHMGEQEKTKSSMHK